MTKKPSYRFAGYDEPWVEKKFGEVVKRSSKSIEDSDLPIVEYEDVISGEGRLNRNVFQKSSNKKGLFFSKDDVLFGKLRPYLQNWLLPTFTGIAVGDWWVLQSHELESKFLYTFIQTSNYQIVANLSTGTKMPRSDWNIVSESRVNFPSLPEQTAIGSFFQDIDQLISLHQRKLEVLKEQKKTYLKLLFPAKGQTKPALRFAGFEADWKEVKLGEVFKISSGFTGDSSLHSGSYKLTRIETISDGLINVKKLGYSNVAPDDSYKLEVGDILFSNINSIEHIGKVALYDKDYGLYHGINLLRLQPIDVNGIFSFYELGTIEKRNWARSHANKAVNQASINQTILSSLNLQIPSLPEQEAIGSFFQDLDKAIAKQEEKVNQLKESKQTLLRKMFI